MYFDCILANPPYAKIGVDITRNVIEQNPDSNYAMLGTRSMFKPFYADTLACQFVQIGKYELGTNKKLDWGVEQAILLATNGWTEVVDNRKKGVMNKVGICECSPKHGLTTYRTSHLVGVNHIYPTQISYQKGRISHLVGAPSALERQARNHRVRNATLVQLSRADTVGVAATHQRSTTLVQVNKSVDVKLRNGYIYVAFETFEEACECAIDIISWTNPTDSHYRCVRWGFVCGLIPHCSMKTN